MAKHNLEQEELISEVKNHIAIVRSAHICRKQAKFAYRGERHLSHDMIDLFSHKWHYYMCYMQSQVMHTYSICFVVDTTAGCIW